MVGKAHPLGPDSATALSHAPLFGNSGTLWLYPTAEKTAHESITENHSAPCRRTLRESVAGKALGWLFWKFPKNKRAYEQGHSPAAQHFENVPHPRALGPTLGLYASFAACILSLWQYFLHFSGLEIMETPKVRIKDNRWLIAIMMLLVSIL